MKLIDSHCHLSDEAFQDDRDFIIKDLDNFGITKIVLASVDIENSRKNLDLAKKYDKVFTQVGVHPENIESFKKEDLIVLEDLAQEDKVVAIGEIGLDYYWRDDNKSKQKEVFISQLELARKLRLPVVIHARDSMNDIYEILKDYKDLKVQIHCFAANLDWMWKFMELGFYISIGGVVTFKNGENEKNAARAVPLDRLMLETDSPYLTPEPYRGSRNDPRKIVEVAREIASLKGMKLSKLAKATSKNAEDFFGI
ncbi:MAG: TatD family hydrolase [Peptoniphilaceae bacterium]|nr:TatD family hydrolase [Peptoniphilaceae bacterium]MDY6019464.1 TatD family hydrolase [Anaerococcus sp.]